MLQDIRYAARVLWQTKAWTAMVVLSLALGIGANTALFTAVNGLVLRKLPVSDPDSLVRFRNVGQNDMVTSSSDYGTVTREDGQPTRTTFSYAIFRELRAANQTLTDMFAGAPMNGVNVVVDGRAEIATAYIASGNYFDVLGVKAILGRTISMNDDEDAVPVVVISHGFWVRRFGRDPAVLGKVIQANNAPLTIVGVLSPEFTGVQRVVAMAPDLTIPLALDAQLNAQAAEPNGPPRLAQGTYWWLQVMGRLKPGVTAQQVQGNLEGIVQQTARQGLDEFLAAMPPEQRGNSQNRNRAAIPRLRVSSGARGVYDNSATEMRLVSVLSVVVGLILLLVCANVANLLLSRAAARQKELSVRLSLGATRGRLIRQLLTESVLLSILGAAGGILVAFWGKQLLPGQTGQGPLDWRVLAFASALAMATGLLFGSAPALRGTRANVSTALKENSRTMSGSRSLLGRSLLVVQVAISLVLLVGAGLFLRTVENLREVDVGFNPRNLVLFRLNPQLNGYDSQRTSTLYDRLTERLRAIPGVQAVTLSNPPLMTGSVNGTWFVVQGRPFSPGPENDINRVRVAPNFFEAMEIPLLAGRPLTERDGETAPKVAVINEAAVRKFFPNESPLGRHFGPTPENSGQFEVVGIVRDARYNSVRDAPPPTMYVPYAQSPISAMAYEVRTAGEPALAIGSIREAARQVDPNLPLIDVATQIEQIERRFAQERLLAQAYILFGGLALLVASVGLFGLMSYSVTRRTNEIGIRMALGAERRQVVRMIMSESLVLVVIGVILGLGAALAGGRLITALLFGVAATDTPTIALAIVVLTGVSAFAGYWPARRASRVDPIVALHYE
jgi:predicted permease